MIETVFLAIAIFTGSGNGTHYKYFPMTSMEVCLASVEKAQLDISDGGDAEGGAVIVCVNGKEE